MSPDPREPGVRHGPGIQESPYGAGVPPAASQRGAPHPTSPAPRSFPPDATAGRSPCSTRGPRPVGTTGACGRPHAGSDPPDILAAPDPGGRRRGEAPRRHAVALRRATDHDTAGPDGATHVTTPHGRRTCGDLPSPPREAIAGRPRRPQSPPRRGHHAHGAPSREGTKAFSMRPEGVHQKAGIVPSYFLPIRLNEVRQVIGLELAAPF